MSRWQHALREWRHNPCLMKPLTALVLIAILLFWLITAILKVPTLILGVLLAKVLQRVPFVVEFLYPTSLGKWIHLTIVEHVVSSRNNIENVRPGDKNRGFHSRCLEQRIEIVPGRVYLHPLPQFLDNLGYLIVCVCFDDDDDDNDGYDHDHDGDDDDIGSDEAATATTLAATRAATKTSLVGFIVDCGQAKSVMKQVEMIREFHYPNTDSGIQIQAILSTHKHHDHTGGNLDFINDPVYGRHLQYVVGGAVEQVPGCNYKVGHGDLVPLPIFKNEDNCESKNYHYNGSRMSPNKNGRKKKKNSSKNDMNALIEVQVICTPAHTRGSVTYMLRPIVQHEEPQNNHDSTTPATFLFTGDTVFCGGSGVPFEADIGSPASSGGLGGSNNNDDPLANLTPTSLIRSTCGVLAVERCFAEILAQCCSSSTSNKIVDSGAVGVPTDRIIFFPGHEYTTELLSRQLMAQTSANSEACKWSRNFSPRFFFETASHLFVASHRRSLPHSSGKLLSAPTTLRRELLINPQLRMLRKRGEQVVRAVHHWHKHFAQVKVPLAISKTTTIAANHHAVDMNDTNGETDISTTTAAEESTVTTTTSTTAYNRKSSFSHSSTQWNLKPSDLDRKVFCTMYDSDLESIINDLASGRLDAATAARHLRQMKDFGSPLDLPTIGRRPVPDTLPSDRSIVRALVGFIVLGSTPSAFTLSDSQQLKLPPPVVSSGGGFGASAGSASDHIGVSKSRLLRVLHALGLLGGSHQQYARMSAMIDQLWKEAREYAVNLASFDPLMLSNKKSTQQPAVSYEAVDVEVEIRTVSDDLVELGALRWVAFGVPQQASFLAKLRTCLPCCGNKPSPTDLAVAKLNLSHPVHSCGLSQHSGELVRHDLQTCPLCIAMTGCQAVRRQDAVEEEQQLDAEEWYPHAITAATNASGFASQPPLNGLSSPASPSSNTATSSRLELKHVPSTSTIDEGMSVEIPRGALDDLLREAY